MSDLFQGQTMTESYKFVSAGTAHTFTFNFQPDKVVFNNLSQWTAVAGNIPRSFWFRDQTVAAQAYQEQVIDAAGAGFNFVDTVIAGFTVADLPSGVPAFRALIAGVTQALPCVITTTVAHGFQTDQVIRITDLGSQMPVPRGMDQLDGQRFRITVLSATTFSLRYVVSDEPVDSTTFVAWVSGGRIDVETRVISLNNPQVAPYNIVPYIPNPFEYDPTTYRLLAGANVMGVVGNVFNIEVYKFGQVTDLGILV